MATGKQVCQFVCQRVVYYFLIGLLLTAITAFCMDYLAMTLPLFSGAYDLANPKPCTALTLPEAIPARSAFMRLPFKGYFYEFQQTDSTYCLAYSETKLTQLPTQVVYTLQGTAVFMPTKHTIGCVALDNLQEINRQFHLFGMSVVLFGVIIIASVICFIASWSVIICCNGWCKCACNAWCLLCQHTDQQGYAVVYTQEMPQQSTQVQVLQPSIYKQEFRQV